VTLIDVFIVLVLLVSILIGAVRGIVREIVALVFWVAALWSAWAFGSLLEPYLGGLLSGPHVRVWVARLIVFVIVLSIGALVGMIIGMLSQHSGLGWLDRLPAAWCSSVCSRSAVSCSNCSQNHGGTNRP
jgi:membrane protein required for colicin V production